MAAVVIERVDLEPFADIEPAKADALIEDAMAIAELIAPCIVDPDFEYPAAAKAILRGAIIRWNESGSGAVTQQTVGPFGQTLASPRRFWPSEITALSALCADSMSGKAFEIDTLPVGAGEGYWSTPDTWVPVVV